jgi:hypothetical protein
MTDYVWPDDLVPSQMTFYLQPHTGGSESPFSRVSKIYGLSAPRWICSMTFRGGYWGTNGLEAYGPRLDGMIAKLRGRQNRVEIYNFVHPKMRGRGWRPTASTSSALIGATTMTITGLLPGTQVHAGDYIGGDGRPHVINFNATVDGSGNAAVEFEPPLSSAVAGGAAIFGNPTGMFRLTDDDFGDNNTAVGEAVEMTLRFVEDL